MLVCAMFIIAMAMSQMIGVSANSEVRVTINGQQVNFADQTPAIIDGRTLVPVRGVFEMLDFDVNWDSTTQTATLVNTYYIVNISIGNKVFINNGQNHTLDVYAQIIGGRTMLPIRAVVESVGYSVAWDSTTNTVVISTNATEQMILAGYSPAPAETEPFVFLLNGVESEISYEINEWQIHTIHINSPWNRTYGSMLMGRLRQIFADYRLTHNGQSINAYDFVEVVANPNRTGILTADRPQRTPVVLTEPTFFTQEQLLSILATAPMPHTTISATPHPERMMTIAERDAWIEEYRELGGIHAYELRIIYDLNEVRVEQGLQPFAICPYLSIAARLHSQLMSDIWFSSHEDPFYGRAGDRVRFFNSELGATENLGGGDNPVDAWYNSPGHRTTMLWPTHRYAGVGWVSGGGFVLKLR